MQQQAERFVNGETSVVARLARAGQLPARAVHAHPVKSLLLIVRERLLRGPTLRSADGLSTGPREISLIVPRLH